MALSAAAVAVAAENSVNDRFSAQGRKLASILLILGPYVALCGETLCQEECVVGPA